MDLLYMLHLFLFSADSDCSESFSTGALFVCFAFTSKLTCRDDYQTLKTPRAPERNANRRYQGARYTVVQILPPEKYSKILFYAPFIVAFCLDE